VVDHVQRTRTDHLNLRLETTFVIGELRRLALCRPGFSLGHLDQVHDCVLDALIMPDLDQRLLAGATTHLDILVRDDLARRHHVVKDDLADDRSAARDRARFIGLRGYANHPCEDNRNKTSRPREEFLHGHPPRANLSQGNPICDYQLTTNWMIGELENWLASRRTKVVRKAGRSRRGALSHCAPRIAQDAGRSIMERWTGQGWRE